MRINRLTAIFTTIVMIVSAVPAETVCASTTGPAPYGEGLYAVAEDVTQNGNEDLPVKAADGIDESETVNAEGTGEKAVTDELQEPEETAEEEYTEETAEVIEDTVEAGETAEAKEVAEPDNTDIDLLTGEPPANVTIRLYLEANGGSFLDGTDTIYKEKSTWDLQTYEVPFREGYAFTGWYSSADCNESDFFSAGTSGTDLYRLKKTPAEGTHVYAGWTDEYWTVIFDMGDGYYQGRNSNYCRMKQMTYRIPKTLRSINVPGVFCPETATSNNCVYPEDPHDSLKGWNTAADGEGTLYTGIYNYVLSSDATLYAQYERDHYVVTVHANDPDYAYFVSSGYDEDGIQYINRHAEEEICTVTVNTDDGFGSLYYPFSQPGSLRSDNLRKQYIGWYLDEACEQQPEVYSDYKCTEPLKESDTYGYIKVTEDMDLYVGWEVSKYILTLDPNGGGFPDDPTGQTLNKECKVFASGKGEEVTDRELKNPKHEDLHMRLTGWYDNPSGTGEPQKGAGVKYTQFAPYTLTKDVTYYAGWVRDLKVITFDLNGGVLPFLYDPTTDFEVKEKSLFDMPTNRQGRLIVNPERDTEPKWPEGDKVFEGWYTQKTGGEKIANIAGTVFEADMTVYAHWTAIHTVTFDANGGRIKCLGKPSTELYETLQCQTGVGGVVSASQCDVLDPKWWEDDAASNTYLFEGWYLGEQKIENLKAFQPDCDVTLTAHWTQRFAVTFDANGGKIRNYDDSLIDTKSYYTKADGTLGIYDYVGDNEIVPPAEDMIFSGWYEEDDETQTVIRYMYEYKPKSNITLKAKYIPIYTITFELGDGYYKVDEQKLKTVTRTTDKEGCVRNYPSLPYVCIDDKTREFSYWYDADDSEKTEINLYNYHPDHNMTLKAFYGDIHTITFDANGGFIKEKMDDASGKSTLKLKTSGRGTILDYMCVDNPYLIGHSNSRKRFEGWYTQKTGGEKVEAVEFHKFSADTTLYAHYYELYEIVFDACGGNIHIYDRTASKYIDVQSCRYIVGLTGELFEYPLNQNVTRRNHRFDGWYIKGTDTKIEDPAHHVFTEDTTLEARWLDSHIVTVDGNGGTFRYWDSSTSATATGQTVSCEVGYGEKLGLRIYGDPVLDGMDFTGWYLNGVRMDNDELENYVPTGDVLIRAGYAKHYTIRFEGNGGHFSFYRQNGDYFSYSTNATFSLNSEHSVLERWPSDAVSYLKNKAFAGWYIGDTRLTDRNMRFDRDVTIHAEYTEGYCVTFDPNGGYFTGENNTISTEVLEIRVPAGRTVREGTPALSEPSNENPNYAFGGWVMQPETGEVDVIDAEAFVPTEHVTFCALWIPIHTVTFDAGTDGETGTIHGTNERMKEYHVRDNEKLCSIPYIRIPTVDFEKDSGMAFAGWYDAEDVSQTVLSDARILDSIITGDITYKAKAVSSHKLTFHANGGQFLSVIADDAEGTTYTVSVADPENSGTQGKEPVVIRDDKVFAGWFYDPSCRDRANVSALRTAGQETIQLYAGWDEGYRITFHSNRSGALFANGSDTLSIRIVRGEPFRYAAQTEPALSQIGTPELQTRPDDGYVLPGWYANGSCTEKVSFGKDFVPTKDMDLYLKWLDGTVEVTFDANGGVFSAYEWWTINDSAKLSENHKRWTVAVPKGITWGELTERPDRFDTMPARSSGCSWAYKDAGCTKQVASDAKISSSVTVYCKWEAEENYQPPLNDGFRITWHAGEGYFLNDGQRVKTMTGICRIYDDKQNAGWYATSVPEIDVEEKVFDGWYLDPQCTLRYDEDYRRTRYASGAFFHEIRFAQEVSDLYAGYTDAIRVRFDANGGYFDDSADRTSDPDRIMRNRMVITEKTVHGGEIMISDLSSRVRMDGTLIFGGWYYDRACSAGKEAETYALDDEAELFCAREDTTLYAKWITYEKPDKIVINGAKTRKINIGAQLKLTVKITGNGSASDVRWAISSYDCGGAEGNAQCVRIDRNGTVTGMAKGNCVVYAEMNGVRSNPVTISVSDKLSADDLILDSGSITLFSGETQTISSRILPEESVSFLSQNVKWTSGDPEIAGVMPTKDGSSAIISAGCKEGKTTITAQLGTIKRTVALTVSCAMKLDRDSVVMTARDGASVSLSVTCLQDFADSVSFCLLDASGLPGERIMAAKKAEKSVDGMSVQTWELTLKNVPELYAPEEWCIHVTASVDDHTIRKNCKLILNPQLAAGPVSAKTAPGDVAKGTRLLLSTETVDAKIYYTTDGTDPDHEQCEEAIANKTADFCSTKRYENAIVIDRSMTIRAYAYKEGRAPGETSSFTYRVADWGDIPDELKENAFYDQIGNVPDGLWYMIEGSLYEAAGATSISRVYTGSAHTFDEEIQVYHGTRKLSPNRDYTITYANNTAVMKDQNATKAPSVTIKGKGSYAGSAVFTFRITEADLDEATLTSEPVITVAAGKKVALSTTKPALTFNGKKLVLNKDYVLEYYPGVVTEGEELPNSVSNPTKEYLTAPGMTYSIRIVAKEGSSFTGQRSEMVIVKSVDGKDKTVVQVSKLKIGDNKGKAISIPYDGEVVTAEKLFDNTKGKTPLAYVYAKSPGDPLLYGKDYTVKLADTDHTSAGTHSFVICGTEGSSGRTVTYVGSLSGTYTIKGVALSTVKIAGLATSAEYTGKEITIRDLFNPEDKVILDRAKNESHPWTGVTLYTTSTKKEGKKTITIYHPLTMSEDGRLGDYTVSMENSGAVGKISLIFTGINGYSGTVKKSITVKAYNINDANRTDKRIRIRTEEAVYSKTGCVPTSVMVWDDNTLLKEGIDYTLTYKNNSKVVTDYETLKESTRPTVVVKGVGNYTGTNATTWFNIAKAGLDEQVVLELSDVLYNAKGKAGYMLSVPKLTDGGKTVTSGKNKDTDAINAKKDCRYYYAEDTIVGNTQRYAGSEVDPADPVAPGTLIRAELVVTVSYGASPYRVGTYRLEGYYRVISFDISKAKVTLATGYKPEFNNGEPVIPLKNEDLIVKIGNERLDPKDYEIVSIEKNTALGNATLVIRGRGVYGGTKALTFKIAAASL